MHADGNLSVNGNITCGGLLTTPGRMHINGGETLFLLNKNGVVVGKHWGGNGNLVVDGISYAGSFQNLSDRKLKKDIKPLSQEDIEKFNKLQPSTYVMKDTNEPTYGFIAQDVETLYPELISVNHENNKTLNYNGMIPIVTGAVQDIRKSVPNNKQLCIEDVCVTKDELLKLKNK